MKEQIVKLICDRLLSDAERLREQFSNSHRDVGVRYAFVDNLLPEDIARSIYDEFPEPGDMRLMDSFRERKYTSKNFEKFDALMSDVTFAVQDPLVVKIVEKITGIQQQIPDEHLYAGGLSAMGPGHFLGPHIDNSHDGDRIYYRTLNLLYYVTPDWSLESGGNLELWNRSVTRNVTIVSKFNRLAIMETNPWSWHSVSEVKEERLRCCVSNYYFSPHSPTSKEYFHVTSFSARPDQKLRRVQAWADNKIRQMLRVIVPRGLGKKDIYRAPRE